MHSQRGRGDKRQINIISLSTNKKIKLHGSKNALCPACKQECAHKEEVEEEELFKKMQGFLNNSTPRKFQTFVEQVIKLPINNMKKLEGTVNLIYEKAMDEPNFIVPYANMCKKLALMNVPLEGGKRVSFKYFLLRKCQKEFEEDKSVAVENIQKEKMKEMKSAKDEEKQKKLQLQLDEDVKKIKIRQLGNIRFIGELFKLKMLISPIMHECIKKLLDQDNEESLECLCTLLKTSGKELDDEGKQFQDAMMDSYFFIMQKLVDKHMTSSRIRVMLQDVINLKKSNWVPRKDENNLKTIHQIHNEAEKEGRKFQQGFQNIPCSKNAPDDCRKISDEEEALPTTMFDNKVCQDLKNLLLSKEFSDVTITVEDHKFKAHWLILAARSSVFASMLRHDPKKKAIEVVNIEDCELSSFPVFLEYLYCGSTEKVSLENVFNLYASADKYDVQDLKRKCLEFMMTHLSVDTFCETLRLSLQHSETKLLKLATEFFIKNFRQIIVTPKWQAFILENPVQGNELFIKATHTSNDTS